MIVNANGDCAKLNCFGFSTCSTGGACALIEFECCRYISDKSEHIASLRRKKGNIKDEGANFYNYFTDDGIFFLIKRDLWSMVDKIVDFCWTCYLLSSYLSIVIRQHCPQ